MDIIIFPPLSMIQTKLVRNCKNSIVELVESKCLDIVFANEDEVAELAIVLELMPTSGMIHYCTHNAKLHFSFV